MQFSDIDVIQKTVKWLAQDKTAWLCTISATYGSSPRPIGSLFSTDGHVRSGSISGGCLEDEFVKMLAKGHFTENVSLFTYGNDLSSGKVLELPCGGTIELIVECLRPTTETIHHLTEWLGAAKNKVAYQRVISRRSEHYEVNVDTNFNEQSIDINEHEIMCNYSQVWQLLILGIGEVSYLVAKLGLLAGYKVQICDMREELAASWHFTSDVGGVDVCWRSPDMFVEEKTTSTTAILALAHDPRIDDVGLMTAFESDAFYLGAMGSHNNSVKRKERLQRICELSEQDIAKLHAPIGLDIGSKTPMEIALSILAHVTQQRYLQR